MTLTFRDSVTARLYLGVIFAGVTLIFGPVISLTLIFQHLGLDLSGHSLETLMGLVLWIALLALALHFDWLGIQRMGREKSLSVFRIDCEPEYLRLTGHKGWQFHYTRRGMSLSKEASTGRSGNTSYYLITRTIEETQADAFFIGYDTEKVSDILAAFAATGGSSRLGQASAPMPREDYFPLPAYHVAILFIGLFVVFIDVLCVNGFSNPDGSDGWVRPAACAIFAFLTTVAYVWLIIQHLTRATGIWIAETCLRVRHAHGKTVEYPYPWYAFDKKWITAKGQSTFILQMWRNGKRIRKFLLGTDEDGAIVEMIFRKLTKARQEALNAAVPGALSPLP